MKQIILVTFVLSLVFSVPTHAQNLIINGDFDANIDGWNYNFNNANWVSNDGASISGDGSFRFGRIISNNAFIWADSGSVVVKPNFTYEVGVFAKLPSSSAANFVAALIYWFDADDNLISDQTYFDAGLEFPIEAWQNLYAVRTAPEHTAYGIFRLTISVGTGGSPDEAFVLWDDVFMLEDTLFISGFE